MLLYYITDRHAFAGDEDHQRRALLRRVAEAVAAGVDYIQLREKDLSTRALERLANEAVSAVRANSSVTRLLVNGRVDVALACGADGIHLPGNSLPASEVRSLWMRSANRAPVIGASTHSVDEVRYAEAHGADFAVLAPIFEKPNTDARGLGLALLSIACHGAPPPDNTEAAPRSLFPVLALGGVKLDNVTACVRAGASGVAGIRLFQEGEVLATVRALRQIGS
ncbi:MAG: thiamine phosphate synthase [Acidobacteriota bacterium]|nr:thiamine phosphate synthase [Acidobacteriota bacterium]